MISINNQTAKELDRPDITFVECYTDTGNYWVSSFNGTFKEASDHFYGQVSYRGYEDLESGSWVEIPETVIRVECS